MNTKFKSLAIQLVACVLGVAVSLAICALLGESPILVLKVLANGAFGSATNTGYVLYYATPLLMTGLSVSWAFRVGLFNIGAEGQMALGGLALTFVCLKLPEQNPYLVWTLAMSAAFVVAGFWGSIAGWLKAYRGTHEVLATILLNYVSYGIVSYAIAGPLRNVESQAPETLQISSQYAFTQFGDFGGSSPLNFSVVINVIFLLLIWFLSEKTVFGFKQRLVGGAAKTARFAGVNVKRQIVIAMFLAGGLAGLAASNEVLGYAYKLKEGFTGGVGFIGIAVALLGRNHPIGIFLSAILFGALQKGALDLDLDTTYISRDLSQVIQGLIIIFVVSQKGISDLLQIVQLKKRRTNE